MIAYRVTNRDEKDRRWQVEPYGDILDLAPGDTMTVEYPHPADLVIEVLLFPGCDQLWVSGPTASDHLLPQDLRHNEVTVWPRNDG